MDESNRIEIKEAIDKVVSKIKEYGTQADHYAKTSGELSALIEEQVKLKDKFLEIAQAYEEFIEKVDKTYNDDILSTCKESFEQIKRSSSNFTSKIDDLVPHIDDSFNNVNKHNDELKNQIASLEEKNDNLNNELLTKLNDLEEKINNFKDEVLLKTNELEQTLSNKSGEIVLGIKNIENVVLESKGSIVENIEKAQSINDNNYKKMKKGNTFCILLIVLNIIIFIALFVMMKLNVI